MMKTVFLLAIAFVAVTGQAANKVPEHYVEFFNAIDHQCGGNDNGYITMYDVDTFNAGIALNDLKKSDKKRGCDKNERIYSTSRESAVKTFNRTIKNETQIRECFEEYVSRANVKQLVEYVGNPNNLGVFASEYNIDTGKLPEDCMYYTYAIYLKSGVKMVFTFNFTD